MGTDEEPFEGEVPLVKVQAAIKEFFQNLTGVDRTHTYVLDGHPEIYYYDIWTFLLGIQEP